MVRILQALSGLALIGATLLFGISARDHWRGDAHIGTLTTPTVIERFRQQGRRQDRIGGAQLPPLVQQAQILAAYLNPPASKPKASPHLTKENKAVVQAPEIRPVNTSPKFELHGISYRPAQPEASLALIWQPDTGRRWVKEGARLGHLTIVEINGDSVLYTDGTDTHTMALDLRQTEVQFAGGHRQRPRVQRSDESRPVVAHWAPVRRIRQIPARRAAQRGVTPADGELETP